MFYLVEITERGSEFHRVFLTNHVIEKGKVHGRQAILLEEFPNVLTFEDARFYVNEEHYTRREGFGYFNY